MDLEMTQTVKELGSYSKGKQSLNGTKLEYNV